jgi:hypothetical protein
LVIDNESPPGAWKAELERAPWAFGQRKPPTVQEVLWTLRKCGFSVEADIIAAELAKSTAETAKSISPDT